LAQQDALWYTAAELQSYRLDLLKQNPHNSFMINKTIDFSDTFKIGLIQLYYFLGGLELRASFLLSMCSTTSAIWPALLFCVGCF
jgi:hypothetical protein